MRRVGEFLICVIEIVFCRLGMKMGEVVIEMDFLILVKMLGF